MGKKIEVNDFFVATILQFKSLLYNKSEWKTRIKISLTVCHSNFLQVWILHML